MARALSLLPLGLVVVVVVATSHAAADAPPPPTGCHLWPFTCPGSKNALPRAPYKQTWQMNLSTIIQPCNNTVRAPTPPHRGPHSTLPHPFLLRLIPLDKG